MIWQSYQATVHDLSGASSSSAAAAASATSMPVQHPSTSPPENHPLVLGGAPPLTAGGSQTSISLTAVSSPSGSSSAGGQRLDSTPHSVETPNQLLTTQQQDNVSDTGSITLCSRSSSYFSCKYEYYHLSSETSQHYCIESMSKQQEQHENYDITIIPLSSPTDNGIILNSPSSMITLPKKRGIFPKPATNIMRAWLFHHLTVSSYVVFPGDESLSMCGSLNDDGGRESVLSDGNGGSGGGSATGTNKRKVPKVFSKEAITKFRAWLFQNLTYFVLCDDVMVIVRCPSFTGK
ncbi:unnamed protein product [Thelazia callipaeda]|uniref:Myotubularin phosphatase domain-containing protein n=1 Tax=Thelazia callipaeda TaxID=103827 RepID=A0A0N5D6P3_THECL|nr:unnamed protein product [Thelazia callipaeda]